MLKYEPLLEFANMMNYSAMGLGNHDFDDGVDGLVPFIDGANFAVLAANINASAAPELVGFQTYYMIIIVLILVLHHRLHESSHPLSLLRCLLLLLPWC